MKRFTLTLALLLALAACASVVSAQTVVVNPTTVEFPASADHSVLAIDGQPMITKYELRVYVEAGMTLLATLDLGKPTPLANIITVTNAGWFAPLQPNTRLVARTVAIGATGEAASGVSAPFGLVGPPHPPGVPTVRK